VVDAAVTAEMVRPNTSMVKKEESTKPIKPESLRMRAKMITVEKEISYER